jgi:hypothetical protein
MFNVLQLALESYGMRPFQGELSCEKHKYLNGLEPLSSGDTS